MKPYFLTLLTVAVSAMLSPVQADALKAAFQSPPDTARPGVYWYFLDGNQNREAMVTDLRAMHDVGIGSITFLEVDLDIPRGPIPFMTEQWQDNVAHSFVEAGKLGMEVILGTGPGWSGSGGSWVPIEDSMQHLVGSSLQVTGPGTLNQCCRFRHRIRRVNSPGSRRPARRMVRGRGGDRLCARPRRNSCWKSMRDSDESPSW